MKTILWGNNVCDVKNHGRVHLMHSKNKKMVTDNSLQEKSPSFYAVVIGGF